MKQTEPKEVTVGGMKFYICPLPAFKAANLTGELAGVITPMIAGLAPLFIGNEENEDVDLMDIDIEKAAPNIADAFSGLSGDKVESLLKKLLIQGKNITVELEDENGNGEAELTRLTEDVVNEIFCGDVQDVFILAFEVIRLNFNGFFKKAGNLFGKAGDMVTKRAII